MVITTRTKLKALGRKSTSVRWNLDALKTTKEEYTKTTDGKVTMYQEEEMDIDLRWSRIKDTIKESATETVGKKRRERKQQWMTEDILNLMEEKRNRKESLSHSEYKTYQK
ncbi:craniofacial development protein 2-like [Elysia marginata]|uniref:Craniofacial development protein 2-like n=1 Tax=Elysia marginata TaxID=1093978 RepID=A0AAV4I9C5_9GAST|nr:craniofacial development protein 2-like [Elysia marginata]